MKHQKFILRACTRCHGDLALDTSEDEFSCLSCGRVHDPKPITLDFSEVTTDHTGERSFRQTRQRLSNLKY